MAKRFSILISLYLKTIQNQLGFSIVRPRILFSVFGLITLILFSFLRGPSIRLSIYDNQQYPGETSSRYEIRVKDPVFLNRSSCCLSSDHKKDICGRGNCTWPCPIPVSSIPLLDKNQQDSRGGNQGFFLETSGSGVLSIRQACAVESLAYQNPNLTVYVLFIDAQINANSTIAAQLTSHYKNVHLITVHLDDYLASTSLEHWYHCTDWRKGPHYVSHLSDGLRFLTVAKYGGYYFDLDVIQTRPVTYLRNFVSMVTRDLIASCAFHADYGSPVMQLAVKEFYTDYKPHIWTHNGPDLLVRTMKKWCRVDNLRSMNLMRCKGFHLLPISSFSPIHFTGMQEFFKNRPTNETGEPPMVSDDVIGVHIFNKLSSDQLVYKNSTQYYTRLARSFCPFSFSIAPAVF